MLKKDPKLRAVESIKFLTQKFQRKEEEDEILEVNVIIKADVVGSIEAILNVLVTYTDDQKCRLNIVHYGVGQISENDLELAETFDGIHSYWIIIYYIIEISFFSSFQQRYTLSIQLC